MTRLYRLPVVFLLLGVAGSCLGASARTEKAPQVPVSKAEEKEGVIVGQALQRPNGTWLGLRVENGIWILRFYDKKKKPLALDVVRGRARWNPSQKTGSMNVVLNPGADGQSLVGNQFVPGPRNFKLFLSLVDKDGKAVESYAVDFRE